MYRSEFCAVMSTCFLSPLPNAILYTRRGWHCEPSQHHCVPVDRSAVHVMMRAMNCDFGVCACAKGQKTCCSRHTHTGRGARRPPSVAALHVARRRRRRLIARLRRLIARLRRHVRGGLQAGAGQHRGPRGLAHSGVQPWRDVAVKPHRLRTTVPAGW